MSVREKERRVALIDPSTIPAPCPQLRKSNWQENIRRGRAAKKTEEPENFNTGDAPTFGLSLYTTYVFISYPLFVEPAPMQTICRRVI